MLRIIAGQFKGRKLLQPTTILTRPTTDKVKEALFSILNSLLLKYSQDWSEHNVVDFFAGSGSLVFECLSRGALYGLALDHGPVALKTITANKAILKLSSIMNVQCCDALHLGQAPQPFSMIFLDPPYSFNSLEVLVDNIINKGWCLPMAWFIFELSAEATTPHHNQIELCVERIYGNIKIVIGLFKTI